ncbi:hypothetical protein PV08_09909 [Exophiala spinifera]|uniref:DUF2470 domain-containing protein n=1 Tax=Exophiala spinifera TaxID=91928 RepID=A0A0D1YCI2_9EURO|nr:uncharacterized protein PV08_09909 [Exophiala spinifera]KIW12631.1 hypothetical protein PV08_09909 [Exophiala spinifera]
MSTEPLLATAAATSAGTAPAAAPPRGAPDAAAMKSRIITHMNADHALSLRLYLMRYAHVPLGGTTGAQMLDIALDHMVLQSGYGRHVVALAPPMKSLLEARERLVAMHASCLADLGLSDVVVDRYVPPARASQVAVTALSLLVFATFPFRDALLDPTTVPGGVWSLAGAAPWLARLGYTLQPYVLSFMVVAHLAETAFLTVPRLKRHWVDVGSWLWWAWVLDCAVEGFGCWTRLDEIVADVEEKRKTRKH